MTKNSNAAAATKPKYDPCKSKPYNRYNIYYILERERFLQSHLTYNPKATDAYSYATANTGYESLEGLPDLPPRYATLELSPDWYMPGE